jgi:hypothetical protein
MYFGLAEPLPGDERSESVELHGRLRIVREALHWGCVAVVVALLVGLDRPLVERIAIAAVATVVLGLMLRLFASWAIRRQRPS